MGVDIGINGRQRIGSGIQRVIYYIESQLILVNGLVLMCRHTEYINKDYTRLQFTACKLNAAAIIRSDLKAALVNAQMPIQPKVDYWSRTDLGVGAAVCRLQPMKMSAVGVSHCIYILLMSI